MVDDRNQSQHSQVSNLLCHHNPKGGQRRPFFDCQKTGIWVYGASKLSGKPTGISRNFQIFFREIPVGLPESFDAPYAQMPVFWQSKKGRLWPPLIRIYTCITRNKFNLIQRFQTFLLTIYRVALGRFVNLDLYVSLPARAATNMAVSICSNFNSRSTQYRLKPPEPPCTPQTKV